MKPPQSEDDPATRAAQGEGELIQPLEYATPAARKRAVAPIAGLACILAAFLFEAIAVVPRESWLVGVFLPLSLLLATVGTGMSIGSLISRINNIWVAILAVILSVTYWSLIVLSGGYRLHL